MYKSGGELLPETEPYQNRGLGLFSPQNCENMNFCCSGRAVCGVMPKQTKAASIQWKDSMAKSKSLRTSALVQPICSVNEKAD